MSQNWLAISNIVSSYFVHENHVANSDPLCNHNLHTNFPETGDFADRYFQLLSTSPEKKDILVQKFGSFFKEII